RDPELAHGAREPGRRGGQGPHVDGRRVARDGELLVLALLEKPETADPYAQVDELARLAERDPARRAGDGARVVGEPLARAVRIGVVRLGLRPVLGHER